MNKPTKILLCVLFLLLMSGCASEKNKEQTNIPTEQNIKQEENVSAEEIIEQNDEKEMEEDIQETENQNIDIRDKELEDIEISFEIDSVSDEKTTVKVCCNNNSNKVFTGDVGIYFYGTSVSDRLGNDMIIVEGLQPGQQSWSVIEIDKYTGNIKMDYEFPNGYTFTEVEKIEAEKDLDTTTAVENSVRLNFDVTSWYSEIQSITVYTDGVCEVISTSEDDNTVIASSVWSCGNDKGVYKVIVKDNLGNILAVFEK